MNPSATRQLRGITICAAMLLLAGTASAGSYIGIDGTSVSLANTVEDGLNPRGLRVRLGMRISEVFDIEAQLGGGSDRTTQIFDQFSAAYMGVYLKGYLPVGRRSALFALAGGSSVELEQTTNTGAFSDDRSGFSYGIGLETQLSNRLDLSADYMRYTLSDDQFSDVSAVNIGLKWYF